MPTPDTTTNVGAALAAARPLSDVFNLATDTTEILAVSHPHDVAVDRYVLEGYQVAPSRGRGTIDTWTRDGFVTAYLQRSGPTTSEAIYVRRFAPQLVAVLNDDSPTGPGWRDWRITLTLEPTTAWQHWLNHQGLNALPTFASIIEDGMDEIVTPSAATVLEIAQTVHVSGTVKVKNASRLADGQTQYVYEEEVEQRAGVAGTLTIPDELVLSVPVFQGTDPVTVRARIKTRRQGGTLTIGYTLVRPDDVIRDVIATQIVAGLDVDLAVPIIDGNAGSPTTPLT